MSLYSTKYRLASCKVSKELLVELEKFILKETENYFAKPEEGKEKIDFESMKKELYHVYIQENQGSQKYSSIEEYKGERLPDFTEAVILDFTSLIDKFFHIKVIFHSSISEHPVLEIALVDLKAKETCKPIADGIVDIVKKHKNSNYLFHNRFVQIGLLFCYTIYSVVNFYLHTSFRFYSPFGLAYNMRFALVFAFFILWFIASIFVRRYTTFDSTQQKIINISYYIGTSIYFLYIAYFIYRTLTIFH